VFRHTDYSGDSLRSYVCLLTNSRFTLEVYINVNIYCLIKKIHDAPRSYSQKSMNIAARSKNLQYIKIN